MVCVSVQVGNPGALASGLLPVQTQNHTITCLLYYHASVLCAFRDIGILMKGAIRLSQNFFISRFMGIVVFQIKGRGTKKKKL